MNILAIIPARGGSKRVPRKNIKMLAGKPLIAHTIEVGLKSKYITRLVVSTEDAEIANVSKSFGAEVFARSMELAQDTTKTPPVMIGVVEGLEKQGYNADIVVLLQVTCPLRDENLIDAVIEKLINSEHDSIFTGFHLMHTMPLWKKHHNGETTSLYDYHLRPRSQEPELNEKIYSEDGAVYAIKIDSFKKHNDFIGENPDIYITPKNLDIDTEEEFKDAESLISSAKR